MPFQPLPPKGYPVFYVLDGDFFFASATEIVRGSANVPQGSVVVGVCYPEIQQRGIAQKKRLRRFCLARRAYRYQHHKQQRRSQAICSLTEETDMLFRGAAVTSRAEPGSSASSKTAVTLSRVFQKLLPIIAEIRATSVDRIARVGLQPAPKGTIEGDRVDTIGPREILSS
jgi:hypothetical protein